MIQKSCSKKNKVDGQALLEVILCATVITLLMVGVMGFLKDQWNRTRCVYLVFESTHAKLTGLSPPQSCTFVQIRETASAVSGEGKCGRFLERVTLPKLEAAQWE